MSERQIQENDEWDTAWNAGVVNPLSILDVFDDPADDVWYYMLGEGTVGQKLAHEPRQMPLGEAMSGVMQDWMAKEGVDTDFVLEVRLEDNPSKNE